MKDYEYQFVRDDGEGVVLTRNGIGARLSHVRLELLVNPAASLWLSYAGAGGDS